MAKKFKERKKSGRVEHPSNEREIGYSRFELAIMRKVWRDLFGEKLTLRPMAFADMVRERIGATAYKKANDFASSKRYFEGRKVHYKCRDGTDIKLPGGEHITRIPMIVLTVYSGLEKPPLPR